jgi:hypothetical protein
VLAAQDKRLKASGYSTASAFLTSSTFGGLSWLAHGTLQSGLWVDNQKRYDELLSGNRLTISRAFGDAGWRTVALLPSNVWKWPRGRHFYKYDTIYDRRDLGYKGQRFGFSKMPDQYALAAFQRLELNRPNRSPVMAEIDLASSHEPWAKLPRMVPWNRIGDGRIFNRVTGQVETVRELWSNPARSSAGTGRAATCRSRSSPTTRASWTGCPTGAGRTDCSPVPRRRSGGWTRSGTASSRPTVTEVG